MSKQSEFVREYLRQRGISQRDAAAMIGCAFPTLNNMLTGKRPFNERWATAMQDVWGFRRAFLILGEEPPFGWEKIRANKGKNPIARSEIPG